MRYYPGGNNHICDPVFDTAGNEVGIIYDAVKFAGESIKTGNALWYVTVQRDDCTTFKTHVKRRAVLPVDNDDPVVEWIESD